MPSWKVCLQTKFNFDILISWILCRRKVSATFSSYFLLCSWEKKIIGKLQSFDWLNLPRTIYQTYYKPFPVAQIDSVLVKKNHSSEWIHLPQTYFKPFPLTQFSLSFSKWFIWLPTWILNGVYCLREGIYCSNPFKFI